MFDWRGVYGLLAKLKARVKGSGPGSTPAPPTLPFTRSSPDTPSVDDPFWSVIYVGKPHPLHEPDSIQVEQEAVVVDPIVAGRASTEQVFAITLCRELGRACPGNLCLALIAGQNGIDQVHRRRIVLVHRAAPSPRRPRPPRGFLLVW